MPTRLSDIVPDSPLQRLLDNAAPGSSIKLPAEEIHAKLMIRTPGLQLCGQGPERTRIIWDDYARKTDIAGLEYNTFRTWTVAVLADSVSMTNLSIENSAGSPGTKGQEVALSVYADSFSMNHCVLSSTQDTLFLGPLPRDLIHRYRDFLPEALRLDKSCRQFFEDCRIEGSVDFIFGCGDAEFRRCDIHSVQDGRDLGYAAAPAHAPEQEHGFLFDHCRFTAAPDVTDGSIYLARPWRDFGMCRFCSCSFGPHIHPLGFDPWQGTRRDLTARFYEIPKTAGRADWAK